MLMFICFSMNPAIEHTGHTVVPVLLLLFIVQSPQNHQINSENEAKHKEYDLLSL